MFLIAAPYGVVTTSISSVPLDMRFGVRLSTLPRNKVQVLSKSVRAAARESRAVLLLIPVDRAFKITLGCAHERYTLCLPYHHRKSWWRSLGHALNDIKLTTDFTKWIRQRAIDCNLWLRTSSGQSSLFHIRPQRILQM